MLEKAVGMAEKDETMYWRVIRDDWGAAEASQGDRR